MKKPTGWNRKVFRVLSLGLAAGLFLQAPMSSLDVQAKTISEVKKEINQTQKELDKLNDNLDNLTEEQELLEEQMDDLNSEIINMLTSISILKDDISEKEAEIADTQVKYEAAKTKEEEQQAAMVLRIQMMYEKGEKSSVAMLLQSSSLGDLLNRLTYASEVQQYEKKMLDKFEDTKNEVHDLWDQLEVEKSDLQKQQASLEEQKAYCDQLMDEMKKQSADYDVKIAQAQQDAAKAKKLLQQEQKELKKLEEAERKRLEEEKRKKAQQAIKTPTAGGSSDYKKIITGSTGSALGKEIAEYGCRFIGNPYVAGGTSLTNGADCSGFTYRIYSDFGYTIPRTSFEQRTAGRGVEYKDAQPGDLICYSGHVAMYIGDGRIVHASSAKTGIKTGNANYKPILAVRRIID